MSKKSFYWGIPSYNRVDRQPMLQNLSQMGYQRDEIILSVQTLADYDAYRERYEKQATIIYREGNNVSDNKNNILDYIVEHCGAARVVMCSDKVRAVNLMGRDKKLRSINTREEMDTLVKKAFFIARQAGAQLWGVAPVANAFFMANTISINLFMLGCFMGIPDPQATRFDQEQPLKEDWEVMLRAISQGKHTIRYNDICLTSTLKTQGGAHSFWNSDGDIINHQCTQRLLRLYPTLVKPHATRANELRYVGPKQTIKQSLQDY